MILNLIQTLKTSIYNTKHTKNTKTHVIFQNVQKVKNQYFPKNNSKTSAVYADLYGIIHILC